MSKKIFDVVKMIKNLCIAISYFHRLKGPLLYISYPEDELSKDEGDRLAELLDLSYTEGLFTIKPEGSYSLNTYIEIPSKLTRGKKEMLLLSVVTRTALSYENEKVVETLLKDFVGKIKMEENLFQAFYKMDEIDLTDAEDERGKYYDILKTWIKDFYNIVNEKVKEQIIMDTE